MLDLIYLYTTARIGIIYNAYSLPVKVNRSSHSICPSISYHLVSCLCVQRNQYSTALHKHGKVFHERIQ